MKRTHGFTLVELMAVVTIIAVIAAVAIMSMRKGRSEYNSDAWANQIRNTAIQARRRAVATGQPFMVEISGANGALRDRIQWCQVAVADCTTPNSMSCANPCNGVGTCEAGQIVFAGNDAMTDKWAAGQDVLGVSNYTFAAGINSLGTTTKQIFFGPKGTVDTICSHVALNGFVPTGFTAYVRAANVTAATNSPGQKRRRVVILGVTGRPRIIDNW
jgi:prepilin-type N-terminal cleavage/methylation domain-containing protein